MYAGPKGFGPELASMFMFPSSILSKRRGGDENAEEEEEVDTAIEQRKRARTGDSEDVEVGRRESRALSLGLGSARGGDDTFDQGGFGGGEDVFGPIDDAPFNFDDNNDTNLNLDDLDPADDRLAPLEFHADGTPKPRKLRAPRRRKIVRKNVDGEEEEFSELEDDIEEEEDKERARVGRLSSRLGSARPSDGGGVYDNFGPEMGTDVYDPVFADLETQSSHGDGGPLDVFDVRPSSLASGSDAAVAGQHRSQRAGSHRSASVRAGSVRASSVARSMIGADEEDLEPTMTQQRTGSASNLQSGISKNTARALTILRRELAVGPREEDSSQHAAAAEEEEEEKEVEQVEKVLSFETISTTKKVCFNFPFPSCLVPALPFALSHSNQRSERPQLTNLHFSLPSSTSNFPSFLHLSLRFSHFSRRPAGPRRPSSLSSSSSGRKTPSNSTKPNLTPTSKFEPRTSSGVRIEAVSTFLPSAAAALRLNPFLILFLSSASRLSPNHLISFVCLWLAVLSFCSFRYCLAYFPVPAAEPLDPARPPQTMLCAYLPFLIVINFGLCV